MFKVETPGLPRRIRRASDASWTGLVGTNNGIASTGNFAKAYNLMNYMAGSVGHIRQYYFVNDPKALTWNSPEKGELKRLIDLRQKEMSFFFKDDWKVNSDLTLNLGLRWDYFGVPFTGNGLTAGLVGGATSIFGGSQGGFGTWLKNPTYNAATETQQTFIGPGSPNPDQMVYNKDKNNFGPAFGFAWQLPWFGKGKTTLRGGYQATFIPIDTADPNGGFGLDNLQRARAHLSPGIRRGCHDQQWVYEHDRFAGADSYESHPQRCCQEYPADGEKADYIHWLSHYGV